MALEADVELGGTDQLFNLLKGRDLQRTGWPGAAGGADHAAARRPGRGQQDEQVKLGNFIGISESPGSIFGKVMSVSDELMFRYYELLSDLSLAEIEN